MVIEFFSGFSWWIGNLVPGVEQISCGWVLQKCCSWGHMSIQSPQPSGGECPNRVAVSFGCFKNEVQTRSLLTSEVLEGDAEYPVPVILHRGPNHPAYGLLAKASNANGGNLQVRWIAIHYLRKFLPSAFEYHPAEKRFQLVTELSVGKRVHVLVRHGGR